MISLTGNQTGLFSVLSVNMSLQDEHDIHTKLKLDLLIFYLIYESSVYDPMIQRVALILYSAGGWTYSKEQTSKILFFISSFHLIAFKFWFASSMKVFA